VVLDARAAGVELATTGGVGCAASAIGGPSGEIAWPVGDGVASLLAAHAIEAMSAAGRIEKYLLNNVELICLMKFLRWNVFYTNSTITPRSSSWPQANWLPAAGWSFSFVVQLSV